MNFNLNHWFHFIFFLSIFSFSENGNAQVRVETILQNDWKFAKGDQPNAAEPNFDDSDWQSVSVPHDWAIAGPFIKDGDGDTGKLPWKDQGWYRKSLDIPADFKEKRILLIFDGVMAFAQVYVNGALAGKWDYGYNSFFLDITEFVRPGEKNQLAVHADTREHESRWYPGAGIYRKVKMIVTNPVYIDIWGTQITTPIIYADSATVRIASTVSNHRSEAAEIRVEQIIYDPAGKETGKKSIKNNLKSGKSEISEVSITLDDPQLWDVDHPHLYKAVTSVYINEKLTDVDTSTFGIRTIAFTADDGFHLNGRRVQLKGVNLHHDHGPLGAAFNRRAMQRQLEIMKEMGANAIRNSHNTAAPELLELCDEMGMLFFNEVFDKYDEKMNFSEEMDFEEFAHRNIRNFITRDRNHPCVFLWSVGNEIGDVQWNIDNGFHRLHTMLNYVNKYDPTRPVTLVCDQMESARLRHFDYYDVHSYNYGRRYRVARELEPNKSVIISESASTVSTRGFYEFPLPDHKTNFTASLQVSSYDFHAPEWAEISDDDFMWQQDEPFIAGEFVWTGFDYLGEPTPKTNKEVLKLGQTDTEAARSSYFGIVDLVGIPKDRFYLYKSHWKPEELTIHILPHWNWSERQGENVPVFVYTNGDCAELFVNGISQGKQCKTPDSKNSTERFRLMWKDVIYEPGDLKAVAYKNGEKIGEKILSTAGEATNLHLSPDRANLSANGEDLSYVLVEARDKNGNLQPLADHEISITLTGEAEIAGVGNGNPQSFEPFQSDKVRLFYGKAMIIVRSKDQPGKVNLEVKSTGLKGAKTQLTIE